MRCADVNSSEWSRKLLRLCFSFSCILSVGGFEQICLVPQYFCEALHTPDAELAASATVRFLYNEGENFVRSRSKDEKRCVTIYKSGQRMGGGRETQKTTHDLIFSRRSVAALEQYFQVCNSHNDQRSSYLHSHTLPIACITLHC